MEEKKPSLLKNALYWGVIMGVILIIYSLIMYFLDLSLEKWVNWISYIFIIAILIFATINYRDKELGGAMTYGQALGFGILTILFAQIINGVYSYIFMKFIDPGIIDKILAMQEDEMIKKGIPEDQIENAMEMVKKFMTPLIINVIAIPVSTFFGFVITLITSIFLQKKPIEIQLES
jgi:hypothetical protein